MIKTVDGGDKMPVAHQQSQEDVTVMSFVEWEFFVLCEIEILGWHKL